MSSSVCCDKRPGEDWRLEEGCDPGPPEAGEAGGGQADTRGHMAADGHTRGRQGAETS